MKNPKSLFPPVAATAAVILLTTLPVQSAEAGEFSRQTTKQRTDDRRAREDTWSNGSGRQITREASVANDRENKTRTSGVMWTGPDGQQASRQDVTQRTESGYTRDSVATGPNGNQAARNESVVNDPEAGSRTRQVVATGPNGGTRTFDDQIQRTEDGYGRSTTLDRANGSVTTRDAGASFGPETETWKKEVTIDHTPPSGDGG